MVSSVLFWVVAPCELVGRYQRFSPEDGDSMFFWNSGICVIVDMASKPRRASLSSSWRPWEAQISALISLVVVNQLIYVKETRCVLTEVGSTFCLVFPWRTSVYRGLNRRWCCGWKLRRTETLKLGVSVLVNRRQSCICCYCELAFWLWLSFMSRYPPPPPPVACFLDFSFSLCQFCCV
jgi:hypothetical protein